MDHGKAVQTASYEVRPPDDAQLHAIMAFLAVTGAFMIRWIAVASFVGILLAALPGSSNASWLSDATGIDVNVSVPVPPHAIVPSVPGVIIGGGPLPGGGAPLFGGGGFPIPGNPINLPIPIGGGNIPGLPVLLPGPLPNVPGLPLPPIPVPVPGVGGTMPIPIPWVPPWAPPPGLPSPGGVVFDPPRIEIRIGDLPAEITKPVDNAFKGFKQIGEALGTAVANPEQAGAVFEEAVRTATTMVADVQRLRQKLVKDAVDLKAKMIPDFLKSGAKELLKPLKQLIEDNPVLMTSLIGTLGLGDPELAAWVKEFTKVECDPVKQISLLDGSPRPRISNEAKLSSPLTNPFKDAGIVGWRETGCWARGIGRIAQEPVRSWDNFWTVDVSLQSFAIGEYLAPLGRYVRLEIRPLGRAHEYANYRHLHEGDVISFSGLLLSDMDGPFLEVHPVDDLEVAANGASTAPTAATSLPGSPIATALGQIPVDPGPTMNFKLYSVKKGDSLSRIAQRAYGCQIWTELRRANKRRVRYPDLIYPNQVLNVPAFWEDETPVPELQARVAHPRCCDPSLDVVGQMEWCSRDHGFNEGATCGLDALAGAALPGLPALAPQPVLGNAWDRTNMLGAAKEAFRGGRHEAAISGALCCQIHNPDYLRLQQCRKKVGAWLSRSS